MSKTPNYDAKVKEILNSTKPGERVCKLTGKKWMMDEEEISWYKKFNVPPMIYHPDIRNYIMTCYWLTFSWWWNKNWKTGERVLSYVHPATGIKVLPDVDWFKEDFTSQAREIDSSRSFFEQMRGLQLSVPLLANRNYKEPHNSITMFSHGDVNSYFVMFTQSKNSLFGEGASEVESSSDFVLGKSMSNSYNVVDGHRIFDCNYVRYSHDCVKSDFVFDCRNCEYCFGAWNQRNKKYLWWNEQLTKEEWEKRRDETDLSCRSHVNELINRFSEVISSEAVWPENFNEKAIDSNGEFLRDVTNIHYGFHCTDGARDCYRVSFTYEESYGSAFCASNINSNNCYTCVNSASSSELKFCDSCQSSQNLEYCLQCFNCTDCFGCVGLNRKQFCIFNKQYEEEEYWQKVDELKSSMMEKGEYGEFFPASMGINPFSQSGAVMYAGAPSEIGDVIGAPMFSDDEDGALGDLRGDGKAKKVSEIPDCISDVEDEIVGQPFYDEEARRYFAFIKPEIQFCRKQKIPLPNRHFMDRMNDLTREFNSVRFVDVACNKCQKEITVSYNAAYPNRKTYCRECYLVHLETNG